MKRIIMLVLVLLLAKEATAQLIEPSEQAQGYLNSKNATVDYATGTFHYQVPIYTLKSGSFELPISLNYISNGVKYNDQPGLLAYNWNLNVGGAITRTMRGRFAENAVFEISDNDNLNEIIQDVNKGRCDGEADIFTASFNGKSIVFFIQFNPMGEYEAVPFEKTNVKIDIIGDCDEWVITDDNGDKYIFREKEYSSDIHFTLGTPQKIQERPFVSAWYLSEIRPVNQSIIQFEYCESVDPSLPNQQQICLVSQQLEEETIYNYGRPILDKPFDFSKYQSEFDDYIYWATYEMRDKIDLDIRDALSAFIDYNSPYISVLAKFKESIMGLRSDLGNISQASYELVDALETINYEYERISGWKSGYLTGAINLLVECLEETNTISSKKERNGGIYKILSPILKQIKCGAESIHFGSQTDWSSLTDIYICDYYGSPISHIALTQQYGLLSQISFLDKNDTMTKIIKLNYFEKLAPTYEQDRWGYYKRKDWKSSAIDSLAIKTNSLKNISFHNGGTIHLDYESNERGVQEHGGIRLRSLCIEDRYSDRIDTIKYKYPDGGILVYEKCVSDETISYDSFDDTIYHSMMKYFGLAFINTGNNGLYYPYVEENLAGKGTNTYLYHTSYGFPWSEDPIFDMYPFWLNGLPLATASYDENGNLIKMIKNTYYTDMTEHGRFWLPNATTSNWFMSCGNNLCDYNQTKIQIKAYDYYMDEDTFADMNGFIYLYPNRRYDVYEEYYIPNFQKRAQTLRLPLHQDWKLYYGGATLLHSQKEFYPNQPTSGPSIQHYSLDLGIPFKSTEYFYDNLQHSTYPTRIVETDSKASKHTKIIKRTTEMTDAVSPIIAKMKEQNMKNSIIKIINLQNDKFLDETVYQYDTLNTQKQIHYVLKNIYMNRISQPIIANTLETVLFKSPIANYTLEKQIGYGHEDQALSIEGDLSIAEIKSSVTDFRYNRTIIKVKHAERSEIAALDLPGNISETLSYYKLVKIIHDGAELIRNNLLQLQSGIEELPDNVKNYMIYSDGFMYMNLLIQYIAEGGAPNSEIYDDESLNNIKNILLNNNSELMYEYYYTLENWIENPPLLDLIIALVEANTITQQFAKAGTFLDINRLNSVNKNIPLKLGKIDPQKTYIAYIFSNTKTETFSYTVTHSGGKTTDRQTVSGPAHPSVKKVELDLKQYSDINSLSITANESDYFFAVVPSNAEFEATCYNLDGTVFGKFDHTGQLEYYEYDAAGRVIKVFNQNGELVKENIYNTVSVL